MDLNRDGIDKMTDLLGELEGKPEDEMVAELANIIRTGQGGLSPVKASQMIRTILPMMEGAQRRKLEKLLRALQQ